METPTRFERWRQNKGWTQVEIAQILGVDPSTISRWECDNRRPTVDKMIAIARRLKCQISDLWEIEPVNEEEAA